MPNVAPDQLERTDTLSRHQKYYIAGGDLHFQVRTTHFRVHKYFFERESKYWKARMAGPVSPGDNPQRPGSHESTAFLVDEDPEDFAAFLWVFYNPRYSIYEAPLEQWTTILRLASLWDCPGIRDFSVSFINNIPMETVRKIKIYQENNVDRKHLLHLYIDLATRDRMLEREEFRILDAETLYSIVKARELLRAPSSTDRGSGESPLSPIRADFTDDERRHIISTAFDVPLEEIQEVTRASSQNSDLKSLPLQGGNERKEAGRGRGRGRGFGSSRVHQ